MIKSLFARRVAGTAALTLLALTTAGGAQAEDNYPSKPIQFIIPYPPGGASDILARILAEKLGDAYKESVIPANRPGANGNIAGEFVVRSKPDGYTLFMGNIGPNAINPAVYTTANFDPIKGLEPVVQTGNVPMLVVVNAALPVKNLRELLDYARKQKDPMILATGGTGSATHLASVLMSNMADTKFLSIQYKGDPLTLTDIIGGHVSLGLVTLPAAIPFLHNDKLRFLAVTTAKRTPTLPDVPTIAEAALPGYDAASWGGVFVPTGTPPAVVNSLSEQFIKILHMPDVKQKLAELGVDVVANKPGEFKTFVDAEVTKWAAVVKKNNIRPE